MKSVFNFLTFILLASLLSSEVFAAVLTQTNQKTHLRWEIQSAQNQIKVSKDGNTVTIQSLDPDFFESFAGDVATVKLNKTYHSNYKFVEPKVSGEPYKLEISLKNQAVELFSFYQSKSKGYILDFWLNEDIVSTKEASAIPSRQSIKVAPITPLNKKKPRKTNKVEEVFGVKKGKNFGVIKPKSISKGNKSKQYRDFRYGAAFIWDYEPLIPPLGEDINLARKTPDYLYKVKDRKYLDDKKESHMQLTINFYNKKQWGLMTRSINLYEEKYGRKDSNRYINDFMKAVSMLRNSISKTIEPKFAAKVDEEGEELAPTSFSKKGVKAAARNLLVNVLDLSTDYELNKAILRYLVQHSRNDEDYIKALDYAKKLYVQASDNADDDMISYSSKVILNSLTNLKQLEKVSAFLGTKAVQRILSPQEGIAYKMYIDLANDDTKTVIRTYEANRRSFAKPVHPSIIYNTAEAMFRNAKYKTAISLYDNFITQYSHLSESSNSRLRIALSYDLLDKETNKVVKLYEDSINKSAKMDIRTESKLRYVGLRVNRNKELTKRDLETISFLNLADAEKKSLSKNNRKLLWLTRMRSMIVTEKYEEALAYLSTIPVDNLRRIDQRSFYADGAEIVLGVIKTAYLKKDYARAVKLWEVYKGKYETRVVKNPYLHFIVTDSFAKLGLYNSYERAYKKLQILNNSFQRRFPLWVDPHMKISIKDYMVELNLGRLLKERKIKELSKYLEANKERKNVNYNFYKGIVSYFNKNYTSSVESFEGLLVAPNINNLLTPEQSQQMIKYYLESLYESATPQRFRKNVVALTDDLRRESNSKVNELLVRADYLYLESLYGEKNVNYKQLKRKANEFLSVYKDSTYGNRVKYLKALAFVNTNEIDGGKSILSEIVNGKDVPEYLKGLARTELSTLKLRNKKL